MSSKSVLIFPPAVSVFDAQDRPTIDLPPPVSSRGHQRSRTTVDLPPLFTRTPSVSPSRASTFMPFGRKSRETSPSRASTISTDSVSPNSETQRKLKPGTVGKIASWFEGCSEPVNITLVPSPKKESPEPFCQLDQIDEVADENTSSMDNLTQRPRKQELSGQNTANSSRFSFFRRTTTTSTRNEPDELVQIDIRDELLPDGPIEEVTPAAVKALQINAESLLRKFQTAYAENLGVLRKIRSEKVSLADDLEASQTRNEHLKMQLLEMAEKAADQEKVIASLKSQLSTPQSSVRMIIEDEEFTVRRHGRRGRSSDVSSSDESFVDSEMSSAVSVFSDAESVRTPATSVAASPMMKHASLYNPTVVQRPPVQAHWQVTPVLVQQCQNCHNVPASEAWDVIEMMKMESSGLKDRIAELESANDAALDFLTTLKA